MTSYANDESKFEAGGDAFNNSTNVSRTTNDSSSVSGAMAFMKQLDAIQEEQVVYVRKIEREKARKEALEKSLDESRKEAQMYRDITRNGEINLDCAKIIAKNTNRLEYQLQSVKIKLSLAKKENIELKLKIDETRRAKLLHVDILAKMEAQIDDYKSKTIEASKELSNVNEKSHKAKIAVGNLTHKMIKDMEDFTRDMNIAKTTLANANEAIMGTVRDKLNSSVSIAPVTFNFSPRRTNKDNAQFEAPVVAIDKNEYIDNIVKGVGLTSLLDLVVQVQTCEERIFSLYNDIQEKNREMEKIETQNKHLGDKLTVQEEELEKLETHNNTVRVELEQHIAQIQKSISKYDVEYASNLDVLNGVTDMLQNILKLVAQEEALDKQLLTVGVNDRTLQQFLGLIENRIDDLLQMQKASNKLSIKKDDFIRVQKTDRVGTIQIDKLPSLHDPDWAKALGFDTEEDDDNGGGNSDDVVRVRPVNLQEYKDNCKKKVKKSINRKAQAAENEAEIGLDEVDLSMSSPKGGANKTTFAGGSASVSAGGTGSLEKTSSTGKDNSKDDNGMKSSSHTPREPEFTNGSSTNPRNKKK